VLLGIIALEEFSSAAGEREREREREIERESVKPLQYYYNALRILN